MWTYPEIFYVDVYVSYNWLWTSGNNCKWERCHYIQWTRSKIMDQEVLHKKLLVAQQVKKCSAFYGTLMFIAVFTRIHREPHDPAHVPTSHSFRIHFNVSNKPHLQKHSKFHIRFLLLMVVPKNPTSSRLCLRFHNALVFYSERLLRMCSTRMLDDHTLFSAHCYFNTFTTALHIRRSSPSLATWERPMQRWRGTYLTCQPVYCEIKFIRPAISFLRFSFSSVTIGRGSYSNKVQKWSRSNTVSCLTTLSRIKRPLRCAREVNRSYVWCRIFSF
jgi:hypothetical protein